MTKFKMFFISLFLLVGLVFAEKSVTLPGLAVPFYIKADDTHLFITDGPTVNIYSLKDYRLVKRFGRAGEGPQEFNVNPRKSAGSVFIFLHTDYLLVNSRGKVSYFSKAGKFIKESRVNSRGTRFQPLGKQFAGEGFSRENNILYNIRNIYDSNFKRGKELYRRKAFSQLEGDMNPFYMVSPITRVYDDKVFINDDEELKIHVFDSRGNKLSSIGCQYKKLVITDEYKKKIRHWYKTYRYFKDRYQLWKNRLKFPEHFPATRWFDVADHKIYVLTHKKKNKKSEFIILDLDGKFLKTVMVPLVEKDERLWYPYTIKNEKLYQLVENHDQEEWELHVTTFDRLR